MTSFVQAFGVIGGALSLAGVAAALMSNEAMRPWIGPLVAVSVALALVGLLCGASSRGSASGRLAMALSLLALLIVFVRLLATSRSHEGAETVHSQFED